MAPRFALKESGHWAGCSADTGASKPTMSAIGPRQTYASALHMSAFGGKADIALSTREHRRLMQKGIVVDLLDEEIRHVSARDETECPVARID
jgi:hypothetical protein